ncbi:MAG: hypothetical protein IJX67_09805 [Oscillospiraceae bacterium]|nr:hypothetical protein [Oscillospiraceae bacterium]MBQ9168685.1 hypothetical protein [Oscillospiraceae bacterium]
MENTSSSPESSEQASVPAQIDEVTQQEYALGKGLTLVEIGKYTGVYMEDGTDEIVSNVLMLIVRNDGDQDIQYAEVTLPLSTGEAKFNLSTLPMGESMVLLEQNRMEWSADNDYSDVTAQNIALFSEPMSLQEDNLTIQALDGVINISNISGADITGDIVIYYKNASADLLYGGITYRVRLEGGLKTDEIRQITASHFSENGSRIMFVTVD